MARIQPESHIVTFREGNIWVAAWTKRDIVSQGRTENEARARLLEAIGLTCVVDVIDGKQPLEDTKPPPDDVAEDWLARHHKEHQR